MSLSLPRTPYRMVNLHCITLCLLALIHTVYGQLSAPVMASDLMLNSLPVFVQQPEENYYLVKNKPVSITCKATQVLQIIFKCADQWVRAKHHVNLELVDPVTGVKYLQTSIDVMREEVEEYFGKGGYWCECHAWNHVSGTGGTSQAESKKSRKGFIQIAFLKKRFEREPVSTKVEMESTAQLLCLPPEGLPLPQVFWLKDGETIDVKKEINYIISNEGNLIINQARLTDMGNYTCGAVNVVSKRLSTSALLTVFVNGGWSTWSVWSECSAKCGKGTQRRSRTCSNPSSVNGGSQCQDGESFQKVSCTSICPVDGIWSTWSSWSTCSPDCIYHRRRSCDEPRPVNGGDYCNGNDLDSQNCSGGMCRARDLRHKTHNSKSSHSPDQPGASKKADVENIALYVGLCVAFAVLVTAVVIIIFLVRRKHYHPPGGYDMDIPNSESHLPPLDNEVKKVNKQTQDMLSVQPDLTQTMVAVRTNPLDSPNTPNNNHLSSKENLPTYAEIMTPANRHSGTLGKCKTLPVEPTLNHSLKKSVEKLTIKDKSSLKASPSESRPLLSGEGEVPNRLSLMTSQLPSNVDIEAVTWKTMDHRGGRLSLPESGTKAGVWLTVPEGAIRRGHTEDVFMAVCRDDKDRPKLSDKQTILSPIVLCGPSSAVFKKPVILSIQHCASMRQGGWILSTYTSDTPIDEASQWQKTVTLGQETINTPLYAQLDPNHCHIMTEQLQRYAIIGESVPGNRAIKVLRLAAFAPTTPPSMDYNIRVYVVEDTQDALEGVYQVERKLGGRVLDKPKQILFQDGGNNLCLTIEELSFGWRSKLAANYQEIPFRHIWSGNQNNLHCSFSLEMVERAQQDVTCVIQVYQKAILNNRQVLHITSCLNDPPSTPSGHSTLRGKSSAVSANSTAFGSMATLDNSKSAFRLPTHVRAQLCMLLDPPNARGTDWRMLAQALTVDRYINYFATKTSPTDHILDLWEARHREDSAVTDLMNILRVMGRLDCSAVLEKDMGAWL